MARWACSTSDRRSRKRDADRLTLLRAERSARRRAINTRHEDHREVCNPGTRSNRTWSLPAAARSFIGRLRTHTVMRSRPRVEQGRQRHREGSCAAPAIRSWLLDAPHHDRVRRCHHGRGRLVRTSARCLPHLASRTRSPRIGPPIRSRAGVLNHARSSTPSPEPRCRTAPPVADPEDGQHGDANHDSTIKNPA